MRDFDLCRDKSLSAGETWKCPQCEHDYDRVAIEQSLVLYCVDRILSCIDLIRKFQVVNQSG